MLLYTQRDLGLNMSYSTFVMGTQTGSLSLVSLFENRTHNEIFVST